MANVWKFLKKIELPYYPAIPFPGIDPKQSKAGLTFKHIFAPMFTAESITTVRRGKETDELQRLSHVLPLRKAGPRDSREELVLHKQDLMQ